MSVYWWRKSVLGICFVCMSLVASAKNDIEMLSDIPMTPTEKAAADSLLNQCLQPLQISTDGPYHDLILTEVLGVSQERMKRLFSVSKTWQSSVKEAHLPSWFSYLPLAISQGDTRYRNTYTAGLWGLTSVVALRYGLQITDNYDERHDPEKSTQAALRYWFDLRPQYENDWMALLAFVNTPALVNNTFVHLREIPFHSLSIEENVLSFWHYHHQSALLEPDFPVNLARLLYWGESLEKLETSSGKDSMVNIPISVDSLSEKTISDSSETLMASQNTCCVLQQVVFLSFLCPTISVSEDYFRSLNPSILEKDRVEAGCPIYLPKELAKVFREKAAEVYALSDDKIKQEEAAYRKAAAAAAAPLIYKIRSGDTLSGIAQRYRVRVSDIRRWNNLKSDRIYAGQKLKIYKKK